MEFEHVIIIHQFELFYYIMTKIVVYIQNRIKDGEAACMLLHRLYGGNQLEKKFHIEKISDLLMDNVL